MLKKKKMLKKINSMLFFSNIWRTLFDQSSPVQPFSEKQKSHKIKKKINNKKMKEEKKLSNKKNKKLSSQFSNIRTQFDQSSLVQPVSDFRGGTLSVTDERTDGRTKEIPVSIIGLSSQQQCRLGINNIVVNSKICLSKI